MKKKPFKANEVIREFGRIKDRFTRAFRDASDWIARNVGKNERSVHSRARRLTVVTQSKEIRDLHAELYRELNVNCSFIKARPEFRTDREHREEYANWKPRVLWSNEHNYWFYFDACSPSRIPKHHDWKRYWCLYGLEKPSSGGKLKIAVELNFHREGSARVAGAFARDEAGRIFVIHSGRAGGGKRGIKAKKLLDCMRKSGTVDSVSWNNRDREVIVITQLGTGKVPAQVGEFVKLIDKCKRGKKRR
jgi:hypothetical protein